MPMDAAPTATFEVIQTELFFCLAKAFFDWPTPEGNSKDLSERPTVTTGYTVGQKVLRFTCQHIAGSNESALVTDKLVGVGLVMRQVTVDARDKNNRVTQFKVVTTILNMSIDGKQIGDLFERRWDGEVDIRSIKSTMQMDILRCKTPDMVHKEIWTHLLAYNLLRTVMAVAADENDTEPRKVSFKGAKQALTAFAPKIEAARPEDRAPLIDALLTTIAYHRVGNRPGRWEPRAQTKTEARRATNATSRHCQAAAESFKMVLGRTGPARSLTSYQQSPTISLLLLCYCYCQRKHRLFDLAAENESHRSRRVSRVATK